MLLFSGYVFNLNEMDSNVVSVTELNPMRWLFQGLMIFKYEDYPDGEEYLKSYGYNGFNKDFVFSYLRNFYYFSGTIFLVVLLPSISRLRRRPRGLVDQEQSGAPSTFAAASSIIGERTGWSYSADTSFKSHSSLFNDNEFDNFAVDSMSTREGPVVDFVGLVYRYDKYSLNALGSPETITVLDRVSGSFKRGLLNGIVGPSGSGRSVLLHILAGNIAHENTSKKDFSGCVNHGGQPIDFRLKPWQRCAFVEFADEFLRDISVKDTIGYAWQLRTASISVDPAAVDRALRLVQLDKVKDKKTKSLTRGQARLLSIAEELVVDNSKLLFVDEPVTDLGAQDVARVMRVLKILERMRYTVVATFHEPTVEVFNLIGECIVLSRGRVAYHGPAADAASFFMASPYKVFIRMFSLVLKL
jgi:ABC-type multidrug transport system ATPase subunit